MWAAGEKRREGSGSGLLIRTNGLPGVPRSHGDRARTVLRIPSTTVSPPLLSLEPEVLPPGCAGSRGDLAHREFPGLQPPESNLVGLG